MSAHAPPRSVASVRVPGDADERLCALQRLSHYLEGYPYQPHHEYTEIATSDPHYVREHVDRMSPGNPHGRRLTRLDNAVATLIDAEVWHTTRECAGCTFPRG